MGVYDEASDSVSCVCEHVYVYACVCNVWVCMTRRLMAVKPACECVSVEEGDRTFDRFGCVSV